jgi:molybdopterin-biosynthesis enzyme MoeA-like protein
MRKRMARVPLTAELVRNAASVAPGFRIGNVFVMAGVPTIMRAMLEDIEPKLTRGAPVHSKTVQARLAEGRIAASLNEIQKNYPELAIGSYPYYREDGFGVQLVARGRNAEKVEAAAREIEDMIRREGVEPVRVSA